MCFGRSEHCGKTLVAAFGVAHFYVLSRFRALRLADGRRAAKQFTMLGKHRVFMLFLLEAIKKGDHAQAVLPIAFGNT
eukprot:7431228-Pyramimonas_sp.AAC.1